MLPISSFADLIGTSVTAFHFAPSGDFYGADTVTVGPGGELFCPGGGFGAGFCTGYVQSALLDIGANTITLTEGCCAGSAYLNGQLYIIDPGMTIYGFTLTSSGFGGLGDLDVFFSGNQIGIRMLDLGTVSSYTLTLDTTAPTPEPDSIALLGTGLLGLAGTIRRKCSAITFR